jgi:short-subunit dehydrogenase
MSEFISNSNTNFILLSFFSTIAINVKAALNVSQVVAKGMIERGTGGSIINVSSTVSLNA